MAAENSWANLDGFANDDPGGANAGDDTNAPHARAPARATPHAFNQVDTLAGETVVVMVKEGVARGREALAESTEKRIREVLDTQKLPVRARVKGSAQGPVEIFATEAEVIALRRAGLIVMHQKADRGH